MERPIHSSPKANTSPAEQIPISKNIPKIADAATGVYGQAASRIDVNNGVPPIVDWWNE